MMPSKPPSKASFSQIVTHQIICQAAMARGSLSQGLRAGVAALCILLLAARAMETGEPSEVLELDAECDAKLDALWLRYTDGGAVEGCDSACLKQCYQTLWDALYATNNKDCPLQTDIQRCFHVSKQGWLRAGTGRRGGYPAWFGPAECLCVEASDTPCLTLLLPCTMPAVLL